MGVTTPRRERSTIAREEIHSHESFTGLGFDYSIGATRNFNERYMAAAPTFFNSRDYQSMRETVRALEGYGLTLDYLRSHWDSGILLQHNFGSTHKNLLIYLVTGRCPPHSEINAPDLTTSQHLSYQEAVNEVDGLNIEQALALFELFKLGLRKVDLLSWERQPGILRTDLGFDFVIRFRGNISVTDNQGETRQAQDWVNAGGRAKILRNANVTSQEYEVPSVVCVKAKKMKQAWCIERILGD